MDYCRERHLISAPRGVHKNGSIVIGGRQELFHSLSARTRNEGEGWESGRASHTCCCLWLHEKTLTVQRGRIVRKYKQAPELTEIIFFSKKAAFGDQQE